MTSTCFYCSHLEGLLGSITKTADVGNCPGKCIHALASLLCDGVVEEVVCPQKNMRCCIDRRSANKKKPPPPNASKPAGNEVSSTTLATVKKVKKKIAKEQVPIPPCAVQRVFVHWGYRLCALQPPFFLIQNSGITNKQDKFGDTDVDYEFTDQQSASSNKSRSSTLVLASIPLLLTLLTIR